MTLSELLRKVSFDELIPTLKGVYDVRTSTPTGRRSMSLCSTKPPDRPTG